MMMKKVMNNLYYKSTFNDVLVSVAPDPDLDPVFLGLPDPDSDP